MEGLEPLLGKWTLTRNENFDAYLAAVGVGFIKRKVAAAFTTTMEIKIEEGDKLRIITKGPKDTDATFKLGEEFETKDPLDNDVKVVCTWDSLKRILTTVATPTDSSKGKKQKVERSIVEGELVMTIYVDEVICKRYFKKEQ